jgi:hypothetical protein
MAKVYYVKDGSYPQNMVDPLGRRIALAELERRLQGQDLHYLGTLPPEFNPHQPAPTARHMDEPPGQRLTRPRPCCFRRPNEGPHAAHLARGHDPISDPSGAARPLPGHHAHA